MQYTIKDLKNAPGSVGIYKITFLNSSSGKVYIGSAMTKSGKRNYSGGFNKRWRTHVSALDLGKHVSKKLQNAYNKYGRENLVFSIEEECEPLIALEREQYYIDLYNSCEWGYNSRPCSKTMLGFRHSKTTKEKIRDIKRRERDKHYLDIIQLYNKGLNLIEISNDLGICKSMISRTLKENGQTKIRKKADYYKITIYQYSVEGDFIREWSSAYECAKTLNLTESHIRKVLNNNRLKIKENIFSYNRLSREDITNRNAAFLERRKNCLSEAASQRMTAERKEQLRQRNLGNNYRKKIENIYQYDRYGNLIKLWGDSKEIIDFFKLKNFSQVLRVIRGQRNHFRQFIWSLHLLN